MPFLRPTPLLAFAAKKKKGLKTIPIKLISAAGTGFFYTMRKNPSSTPDKMAAVKYDPVVRKRVLFTESKIK